MSNFLQRSLQRSELPGDPGEALEAVPGGREGEGEEMRRKALWPADPTLLRPLDTPT